MQDMMVMVMITIPSPIKLEPFREIGQGVEGLGRMLRFLEDFDVFIGAFHSSLYFTSKADEQPD